MLAYELGCKEIEPQIIEEAALRFIHGDVERDEHKFAPSVPEFVRECRVRAEYAKLRKALPAQVMQFPKSKFVQKFEAERAKDEADHGETAI